MDNCILLQRKEYLFCDGHIRSSLRTHYFGDIFITEFKEIIAMGLDKFGVVNFA